MVRETRHLWVGNLPDNIREDRIREHFKRYGRVQSVKLLLRSVKEETSENTTACTVAFMDIKSASKAHTAEHKIDDRTLTTEYYEPTAIPSAASPQNTNNTTYSTSPGSTRFTNNHGTTDEHGTFIERFYERNNSRVAEGDYIRRPSYHDSRGRNKDRCYRNGPYNNSIERHRPLNNSWSYDGSRSYNSETGYGTTPSDTNDRRSSDSQSTKKKKSCSGSRSASPSGSTCSRSPTRSRSQSSSSSSSSTTSQESSSNSSPKCRRMAANVSLQVVVHSDDRRPLAICVRNLPLRSSDTSLKDGLFHEYKKHGKVTWVKIVGQGSERHAIVCFKKPEDVDKALEVSYDKLFFGCKIEVAPYQGYDVDDNELRPYEAEIDEFHPKATRTLFIGNLEKDVTASDLRKHFDQFGEIIEIDIKKQGAVSSYAFCQYSDIISVVKAIRAMDGEHLGNNRIKLGFGKSMPTNCVWVDGVVDSVNEKYLTLQFDSFGPISQVMIDRDKGQALIFYEQVVNAQAAVLKMRGVNLRGRKMQVDFASRECQEAFYEHLEKQGHVPEKVNFEERREPATRSFDATAAPTPNRFTRYDTPSTRPRTASYSSRSSVTAGPCNAATTVHSPSTPGSTTPRTSGTRSRLARFTEYYDQMSEYGERRYRSYDEYSQGSAASHEDGYEQEYAYNRDSPSHVDTVETRTLPHANTEHSGSTFAPPDIRNLQKERFHLLEQLEDYASSGDELVSAKKRMRLEILEGTVNSDVVVEGNRDHRKVMEVRRTSDAAKHHSRRPSIDSKHVREVGVDRGLYIPHAVCKRRKTVGSDSSARVPHHDLSGSESVGSSRPGTPLCDERPENLPAEPRRIPREREGPLSLPLPRFAAQVMGKGNVSVAGIKGQKDNVLSSPPPAATSPRISNPATLSIAHVPPPASPPPRPPSLSSNSSDSDGTPPSPSLDERIRSLDEKYEKWSGSRAVSAAGTEALAKLDASASERFKFSYKLLDLDLKELQPSEIVKSVLAKPSVFDEDSKRLENVGEKYDFSKTTTVSAVTTTVTIASSTPPILKVVVPTVMLPKTPTMLSPRSLASNITTAKSLQYPFPSHPPSIGPTSTPPLQTTPPPPPPPPLPPPPPPQTPPPPPPPPLPCSLSSNATARVAHGDIKLPSCPNSTIDDNRNLCKVGVNRSASNGATISNLTQVKISESNNKNSVSIPVTCSESVESINTNSNAVDRNNLQTISAREIKSSDKVMNRRDSINNICSPRGEVKIRRHSENSGRKSDTCDKQPNDTFHTSVSDRRFEDLEKTECHKLEQRQENERLQHVQKEHVDIELSQKHRHDRENEKVEGERKKVRDEQHHHERIEKEKCEKETRDRLELDKRAKREKEETKSNRESEEKEKIHVQEPERQERVRKRVDDEERKHTTKEDNNEKRKEEHFRHRELNIDTKHRDSVETVRNDKNTKDNREVAKIPVESRHGHEMKSHFENRERHNHDVRKEDKYKCHMVDERRKESTKENWEGNINEKMMASESTKENKPSAIESRHFSLEFDKNKIDLSRRKERNCSLPANIGSKRRTSSQDSMEINDEIKKIKLCQEQHRKLPERRDSKDTRYDDRNRNKHRNNITKIVEGKMKQDKATSVKDEDKRKEKDREEKHKHKQKLEKQKPKDRNREKESPNCARPLGDKEFLSRLELQATDESEKLQRQRKEIREKIKQEVVEGDELKKSEEKKKEKHLSSERKSRDENPNIPKIDERKQPKKERLRKYTHNSSDAATDSDEPKKASHSIFDIVDDEPAYISMYDKVKARSCKNMQKQEEEKRQEKLKAKFNQLKQSRAKREEKKRSTSWDEDSDSDHERRESISKDGSRVRRGIKMLIMSSEDEDDDCRNKSLKKRDIYTDSDSDKHRQTKSEHMETSDDERVKIKNLQRKRSKSLIASDTSEDEFKKRRNTIQVDMFSDIELEHRFMDLEKKSHKLIKDDNKYVKTEKMEKMERHEEITSDTTNAQTLNASPLSDRKSEDVPMFAEISSAEDNDIKKDKGEIRRKHKKKQKRQKYSITSEDDVKLELTVDVVKDENIERMSNSEKKKQHGKKERKKDKNKEDEKHKEKSKKSRKSKSEFTKSDSKRDGKMENIFGSFSDDSENGGKEQEKIVRLQNAVLHQFDDEKLPMYSSDSDSIPHIEKEHVKVEEKEREKGDHKKRKEKKRREKDKRIKSEEFNENSMDYADLGKQLEANIKDDLEPMEDNIKTEWKHEEINCISEGQERPEMKVLQERKEIKEKKKKRKKSKEERHKHHHHHHHHDKNKLKSPEIKREFDLLLGDSIKTENDKPVLQSPSLPHILDFPSPPLNNSCTSDYSGELAKTPSKDKLREKLIPGFGSDIDENIHDTAIKSISEFEPAKTEAASESNGEEIEPVKLEVTDDKPRVIISQEETEDAVAALLGESFGGNEYSNCYSDEQPIIANVEQEETAAVEENIVEDLEEMRQAVQSLNSGDLEIKPETPQSEHDLQIDTDTDEQEDVGVRSDQSPRTPDMIDLSQPPKTPDIPNELRTDDKAKVSLHIKGTNLNSPPSLTPIKPIITESKSLMENISRASSPTKPTCEDMPATSHTWSLNDGKPMETLICEPNQSVLPPVISAAEIKKPISAAPTKSIYSTIPSPKNIIATEQPPIQSIKPDTEGANPHVMAIQQNVNKSLTAVPYSMAVHLQYKPTSLQKPPIQLSSSGTSHSTNVTPSGVFNRLPITPVMMSKPFQPATMNLPQPKLAQVDAVSDRNHIQAPRIPYQQNAHNQNHDMVQLTRAKPSYGYPHTYMPQILTKEHNINENSRISLTPSEPPMLVPTSHACSSVCTPTQIYHSALVQPQSIIADSKQSNIAVPTEIKPFIPVIQTATKLVNVPSTASLHMQAVSKSQPIAHPVSIVSDNREPEKTAITNLGTIVATPNTVTEIVATDAKEIKSETYKELILTNVCADLSVKDEEPLESEVVKHEIKRNTERTADIGELDLKSIQNNQDSVIKKNENLDDDKVETESIESDISKEKISPDITNKDDALDSKEDSDYWSAKEVNIDSVIKKVDALCSADELSDRSSEIGRDDWYEHEINSDLVKMETVDVALQGSNTKMEIALSTDNTTKASDITMEEIQQPEEEKDISYRGGRRGGRARGRKTRGLPRSGVQTRHSKVVKEAPAPVTTAKRGGRGGRHKNERRLHKTELETADVYEFRDDSDENIFNKDRPRLILTIKSPTVPNSYNENVIGTVLTKEVQKEENDLTKVETKEEFVSPVNTRKSRRLQERDISRNTVDDTIEDVVRNTTMVTRSSAAAAQGQIRRSARQTTAKQIPEAPRKSPRAGTKKSERRASDATDDSSEEKLAKNENVKNEVQVEEVKVSPIVEPSKELLKSERIDVLKEKPYEGLKAAVLRRVKGEMNQQEPMTLIDPVTGLLIPMRECEEGRYIPVSGNNQLQNVKHINAHTKQLPCLQVAPVPKPVEPHLQAIIATSPAVVQQHKPQSLKAHVLSSQATRVVPQQQQPQKLVTLTPTLAQPTFMVKSTIPVTQNLNISVSSPNLAPVHISPRTNVTSKTIRATTNCMKNPQQQQSQPPSPNQIITQINQTKQQQIVQPLSKQPILSKTHLASPTVSNVNSQNMNAQLTYAKQVALAKGQVIKPHTMHPQPQILTGAVASPPLKQTPHHVSQQAIVGASSGRLVQGSASVPCASAKGTMEPPKVDIGMGGCVIVPHPTSSPQNQPRHVLQSSLPMPAFEASLHGDRGVYNCSRSPPPAHQNSPSPQGDSMTHFPPGSVKLRPPHDLLPAHYMHPQHVMYQQYLRQSYHLPRSPLLSSNLEKVGDGQEGEEAPVELRRPGSVGLALTGRSPAVPHSLQSPHDRTTDSPQIGQVYNMHNSHMQHYTRYYEQAAEPPPAHRPLTSHSSLGGSERTLSHLATSDNRPLSGHSSLPSSLPSNHVNSLSAADRALSTHITERPLSNHGFTIGTGLGAAGNLMGAVARHIGAEAPASQRGIQAATPPHASQVPPQAESLLMLLKQYPCMWQGLLALKNDQAAVQMYFVSGNDRVAKCSLPKNTDGSTPPLRIFQRMRLEPPQVEGVARKMQMENEHCMLLALPCGHDHMDVLKQSTNLTNGFITYLQQKQAAGIVNVAAPGTTQPPAYVVHIFPSCDFVNDNLRRIAPNLLERVSDIAHLLIVITTV